MSGMKRFTLIFLSCLLAFTASGQGKLICSSEDRRPAWTKRDVDRYEVMKASGESTVSLEDAKEKAFAELRGTVVRSVSSYLMSTDIVGTDAGEVKKNVENSLFVRNISESTAIQVYWEHRMVRKQDVYIYYVLYNFNDTEKKKAALEINREHSNTTKILNSL